YPAGVGDVGRAIQRHVHSIMSGFSRRLREEVPIARGQSDPVLQDHVAAFIADVGQTLVEVAGRSGTKSLVRDGSEIQRLIADLHGRQRVRCGWTVEALTRETDLLTDIVTETVRRECESMDASDVETALAAVRRMIESAAAISARHLPAEDRDAGS